jgi:hypothetical protein
MRSILRSAWLVGFSAAWLVLPVVGCDGGGGDSADEAGEGTGAESGDGGESGEGGEGQGEGGGPIDTTVPAEEMPQAAAPTLEGIHVAPEGNDDAGDGSEGNPYRTVQWVLDSVAQPGDAIIVHEGVYEEPFRIRTSDITVQAAEGATPHIQCPLNFDENEPLLCVEIDAETTGVTLRGLEISGGFYAVYLGSQWDWDDTPLDNLAARNVLIEDCILHDTGRDTVKLPAGCDNVTIRRCEIYNSGMGYPPGTATQDKNAEGIDVVNSDNFWLSDSYIHDTATSGVYVKGGSIGSIIERTTVENTGELGIGVGSDSSPEWFDTVANPDYYENIGGTVRNCVVRNTGNAGIGLFSSLDAHVLHNTVVNAASANHAGIYLGIVTQDYDERAGRPPNRNPQIVGNIVDQSGMEAPQCFGIRWTEEGAPVGILMGLEGDATINGNLYWSDSGFCSFDDQRPDSLLEYADFAGWQGHSLGADTDSLWMDPMLDDTGHLQAGSPAVDGLEAIDGVSYDIDGDARSGRYDIGADEL